MYCMVIRRIMSGLYLAYGTVRNAGGGASSVVTALNFKLRWNVDHEERAFRQ